MSLHNTNYDARRAFCKLAEEYCSFIDSFRDGRPEDLYSVLEKLLARLHGGILTIVSEVPEHDDQVFDEIGMSHKEWDILAKLIQATTAQESDALCLWHESIRSPAKPGDDDDMIRAGMLWDDLADIYRDLHGGLVLWKIGTTESQIEAAWQWRNNYEIHWGYHLFRASQTVYEIRYRLFDD